MTEPSDRQDDGETQQSKIEEWLTRPVYGHRKVLVGPKLTNAAALLATLVFLTAFGVIWIAY